MYVSEEEQMGRDGEEETGTPSDGPLDVACYPETDGVVFGEDGREYDIDPVKLELGTGGLSMESLRLAFKRRISDPKIEKERGTGKTRSFKRKRWLTSQEKRLAGLAHHQELWYMAASGLGGGLGLDYSQEGLKTGYVSDLPQMNMSVSDTQGEKVSTMAANTVSQYSLEDSSCGAGEGSSGMASIGTTEGGDESVAVVGSTSSVTGPVICEHCGMTFPSAHALAVHSRSVHLLYTCPCCGKHFYHSANFTRHMAVHRVAGKSHQCPLCYKTFTQKSTLIDHMNLHSGERPHRCAYCHARFAHKPALRRHLKEQHGKTTGQNSLHEQEEIERAREAAGRMRQEEQECLISEQMS